ncbi:helix-turn-helix domain-containing protein [Lysinibacillus fusiformis]|uniref:helix-turn-helix domain-containing protein n=1 Tax=Lysinibacillus fusiformis TaxID=28031 RepID=UPI002EB951BE|nr:helix-turn-helix domain-containing protein [Lysinibacillus fusiformis]
MNITEEMLDLKCIMEAALKEVIKEHKLVTKEWFSLKEAAEYIGVSPNTLAKYREMGLKVFVVEGVSRVSRKEIDSFLETHSN